MIPLCIPIATIDERSYARPLPSNGCGRVTVKQNCDLEFYFLDFY
jgi:hypothetical protein